MWLVTRTLGLGQDDAGVEARSEGVAHNDGAVVGATDGNLGAGEVNDGTNDGISEGDKLGGGGRGRGSG